MTALLSFLQITHHSLVCFGFCFIFILKPLLLALLFWDVSVLRAPKQNNVSVFILLFN